MFLGVFLRLHFFQVNLDKTAMGAAMGHYVSNLFGNHAVLPLWGHSRSAGVGLLGFVRYALCVCARSARHVPKRHVRRPPLVNHIHGQE